MPRSKPAAPVRKDPSNWEHYDLFGRVHEAIHALPIHFRSETFIEGMLVKDIFTLNSALGASIEEQTVRTLNRIRSVWDPDDRYQTYGFVRESQAFPDVRLQRLTNGPDILMGIELKGWYMLSREGEPSFRFKASAAACNPWDLIVVVPWVLTNILAGSPMVYPCFIDFAKFTAEQRTFYWQHERTTRGDNEIKFAQNVAPYPAKADQVSDQAVSDTGGNFGRIARYGVMERTFRRSRFEFGRISGGRQEAGIEPPKRSTAFLATRLMSS